MRGIELAAASAARNHGLPPAAARGSGRRSGQPGSRGGFTLVEAIASVVVVATLASVGSAVMYAAIGAYRSAAETLQLHEEVSTAMETITRVLREIPRDSGSPEPAPAISQVSSTAIAFAGSSSLSLTGMQLRLVQGGQPFRTLLENVSALTIRCYDADNALLPATLAGSDCRAIRRVSVEVTVRRGGVAETLRTRVFIRSLAGESGS